MLTRKRTSLKRRKRRQFDAAIAALSTERQYTILTYLHAFMRACASRADLGGEVGQIGNKHVN